MSPGYVQPLSGRLTRFLSRCVARLPVILRHVQLLLVERDTRGWRVSQSMDFSAVRKARSRWVKPDSDRRAASKEVVPVWLWQCQPSGNRRQVK